LKKERRQLTRRELGQITSNKPVVKHVPAPDTHHRTVMSLGVGFVNGVLTRAAVVESEASPATSNDKGSGG
jgi:hypothetical protein